MTPTRYVAGFLLDPPGARVVLVRKNRPAFQRGLLNAVGGKIEGGESVEEAMRREFREEAGLDVAAWRGEAVLSGPGFEVTFLSARTADVDGARTMTDEPIEVRAVADVLLRRVPVLRNLPLLLALCLDDSGIARPVHLWGGIPQ